MGGLLGKETSGEGWFVGRRDEDAASAVLRFGPSMNADAGASGHLVQDRQQALELGASGHADAVDERWDEVVGILNGRANGGQVLFVDTGAS